MKTYIYIIENISNNPFEIYIGKTSNAYAREFQHKQKFGNQIKITYIDEVHSTKKEKWKPLECYWIEQFKQWGFQLENKNKGGGGVEMCSLETKHKISISNSKPRNSTINMKKPKPKGFGKLISKKTKGVPKGPKTTEHKTKISKAMMKPILQYDKENNFIQEWESALVASKSLNKSSGAGINEVCRGLRKSLYSYIWKFKE
jgi:hypothetical protein